MCGIVGAVGKGPVVQLLIDGLKKLEYRGYDSAGIAIIDDLYQLKRFRVAGKVKELEQVIPDQVSHSSTGIAHTRWATHGVPSEKNAHPFVSKGEFALVHNGIIENHATLRAKLEQAGYEFHSDTDTEVIVHLLHHHFSEHQEMLKAVRNTIGELEGAYALGIIAKQYPQRLIAVRQGSPLVIGRGQHGNFIASDPLALLSLTQDFIYLEDHDLADLNLEGITIYTKDQKTVDRKTHTLTLTSDATERGEYRHFMKKEIMEQPQAVINCLEGRISKKVSPGIFGHHAENLLPQVEHIQMVACGTSYHAALTAKYWIEDLTGIPVSVEVASEFRYRQMSVTENSLFVTLSQSGETADTLAALRLAKQKKYLSTLVICNAPGSTMVREADLHLLTRAGVEIGVASTKSFLTQLTALFLLTLTLRQQKLRDVDGQDEMLDHLKVLPKVIKDILKLDADIKSCAAQLIQKQHMIFLGRGALFPIALEGALKMKEISYIHAEGYPAGELKHGPLALVDPNMPVIACVPRDHLFEKNLSNLQEIKARGGNLYLFSDASEKIKSEPLFKDTTVIPMPTLHSYLNPMLYAIPLQLLSYHVAVLKGTDVDQPRNLAKSVTVE